MKRLSKDNVRSIIMLVCLAVTVIVMVLLNTSCDPVSETGRKQLEAQHAVSAAQYRRSIENAVMDSLKSNIYTVSVIAYRNDSCVAYIDRTVVGRRTADSIVVVESEAFAKYISPDSISTNLRQLIVE